MAKIFRNCVLAIVLIKATSFAGVIINFDDLEEPGPDIVPISSSFYSSNNFTIKSHNFFYAQQDLSHVYAGSAGLAARYDSLITLSSTELFDLNTIDLSYLFNGGGSLGVTFNAYDASDNIIGTQSFRPASFGFTSFNFNNNFRNISRVEWFQGDNLFNSHQFDNIVLNKEYAVPEPATMFLLGIGLLGIIGVRKPPPVI